MCLIAIAHRAAPGIELLVAANRDEFFQRPAAQAAFWKDHPQLLAGRDLRAGGTWLGLSRDGRFAAITNYRNPGYRREDAPSRGALVADFLLGEEAPGHYADRLADGASAFNGFSLLAAHGEQLWFCSNRDAAPYRVGAGVHGLSNHLLNEPWPKVRRAKEGVAALLARPFDAEDCFQILADTSPAPDAELPETGIGLDRERRSSAIRIVDPLYGTRCSTVIVIRTGGEAEFHERTFAADGSATGTVSFGFTVQASSSPRGESPPPRTGGRAR